MFKYFFPKSAQHISTLVLCGTLLSCSTSTKNQTQNTPPASNSTVSNYISQTRQMTFEGLRSGEGYFNPDGHLMIFQSERDSENPFYQIYVKNLKTDKTYRLSPGYGKTTCGWIAPDSQSAIFSSTHLDKASLANQKAEIDFRKSGKTRRYSWDYDENYDIFEAPIGGGKFKNLTNTLGYDAEGSISPNGKYIAFASNRLAYTSNLSADDQARRDKDPSYFMEIYIMNRDGSDVRRLSNSPGYDGGPFFSPDGKRIVWRRFSTNGHVAEVFTMNIDGTDEKQLTDLKAVTWAPFYHPSGDYIVFTTSVLGHDNFELYIVDTDGKKSPVRVTDLPGFDGLPVFTPDGNSLTWNRKINANESQIMIANWNDALARESLGLPRIFPRIEQLAHTVEIKDLSQFIKYLASKDMKGRATGSEAEVRWTTDVADYFSRLGLQPAVGSNFIRDFSFLKEATLGPKNELVAIHSTQQKLELNSAWRPLAFSMEGEFSASDVVFVGYGIRAPGDKDNKSYDSYLDIDVKDKWVMAFRYSPESTSADRRIYLQRYSRLEHKAVLAKEMGARGIIFVNGPTANSKETLISFRRPTGTDIGIAAISLSDEMADQFFKIHQKNIKDIQKDLDLEKPTQAIEFKNIKLAASIDIQEVTGKGRNVVALLRVPGAQKTILIGAHGDHLGIESENSLKTSQDKEQIHFGADDNASGAAVVLELAHYFSSMVKKSPQSLKQNIAFAIWSGEELGNLGSTSFLSQKTKMKQPINAYVNLDMVGRWSKNPQTKMLNPLLIQGVGSSTQWRKIIENLKITDPIQLQDDPYLPTDAMSFYINKHPVISFFTGVHSDYHSPRDTEDKINYEGLVSVTNIVQNLVHNIASKNLNIDYLNTPRASSPARRGFRIFLGTIPDYSQESVKGVALSGVVTNGPADKAGLRKGDIIVEFSAQKISNIHDYVFALETLRPNESTTIVVLRNGEKMPLSIVPEARE